MACCGSFQEGLVHSLNGAKASIDEARIRALKKILKVICAGTRRLLRLASEIQKGPLGVNWRQTSLGEFYKPIVLAGEKKTRGKKNWSDDSTTEAQTDNKYKKNKYLIKDSKILLGIIFQNTNQTSRNVYWEFKAG